MANTSYLKSVVEPYVVRWLSDRIGVPLKQRRVPIGPRIDGEYVHFEFDGVSDDGEVGVLASTSQTVKPGGTRKLHVDASILLQASFARRFMIFVSHAVDDAPSQHDAEIVARPLNGTTRSNRPAGKSANGIPASVTRKGRASAGRRGRS
jgi:hypothetical protein